MNLFVLSFGVFLAGCFLSKNSKDREMLKDLGAYEFHHRSSKCQGRIVKHADHDFHQYALKGLKERGHKPIPLEANKRLFAGEFYFVLEKKQSVDGKRRLYKDCSVTVVFKKAQGTTPANDDEIFYKGQGYRNRPRITLEGRERCYKAFDEALLNIPYCVTPKEWERLEKIFGK